VGFSVVGIAAAFLIMPLSAPVSVGAQEPPVTWTFMMYLDGDDNLEPYSSIDMWGGLEVDPFTLSSSATRLLPFGPRRAWHSCQHDGMH
jgi:hypothetical protein